MSAASFNAVPLRTKLLYGFGGFGAEALNQSRTAWLIYFYAPPDDADRNQILGRTLVTVLLFAGRLIEAFDDLLIGYWSDRTRSRFGRRIPFILAGAPLWALSALLIFVPPAHSGTLVTAGYFFVVLQVFFLTATISGVPYEALLPEIAGTTAERVSVSGYRVAIGIAGAGVGLIGSGLMVSLFGFTGMAATISVLALASRYAGVAGVWKRSTGISPSEGLSFRGAIRATLTNRHYIILMPSWMLFQTGLGMLIGVLPFYATAILEKEDEGLWASILTAAAIASTAVMLPVFVWLAGRTSPGRAYGSAMLMAAVAFPLLALPGLFSGIPVTGHALLTLLLVGAPVAAVYIFPGPLIADIADQDLETSGIRREGTFYAGQTTVDKTVGSLSPLLLGLILLLGNTADAPLGVRLVGPAAGALALIAFIVFRRFDLPARSTAVG
ncbi:MAG: MFS transporter [Thermomicrobiales bacterium]